MLGSQGKKLWIVLDEIPASAGRTRSVWDSVRALGRPCFKLEIDYPMPLAGVDEAGCAPLAGPVVAAAVILDREKFPRGIDDSKKLPIETREAIFGRLEKVAR